MAQPDNFALFQPLVLGDALAGGPRAARAPAGRSSAAGCWSGWRRSPGTTACWSLATLGLAVRLGPLARLAVGGRPDRRRSRSRRPSAASRSSSSSWPRGGCASSRSSARSRRRPRRARVLFIRDDRRVELHHDAGDARPPPRHGLGPLLVHAGSAGWSPRSTSSRRSSAASCSCRSWSSAAGRAGARSTSGRSSSTPRSCSPSRRSSRRSTSRAARSSTRPSRWRRSLHPGARGRRRRRRLDRRAGARPGTRDRRHPVLHRRGRRRSPCSCAVAGSLVVHAAWDGRRERAARPSRRPSTRPARPPSDRLMSHRRGGDQVLDRATAASSWPTTRSTRSSEVARAYDIRWLVLDGRHRPGRDAGPGRRAARLDRPADSTTGIDGLDASTRVRARRR